LNKKNSNPSSTVAANPSKNINYDEANINAIKSAWKTERENPAASSQTYTMVQANAPCKVNITMESRNACVKALLR
jgi:hypothetical protein